MVVTLAAFSLRICPVFGQRMIGVSERLMINFCVSFAKKGKKKQHRKNNDLLSSRFCLKLSVTTVPTPIASLTHPPHIHAASQLVKQQRLCKVCSFPVCGAALTSLLHPTTSARPGGGGVKTAEKCSKQPGDPAPGDGSEL